MFGVDSNPLLHSSAFYGQQDSVHIDPSVTVSPGVGMNGHGVLTMGAAGDGGAFGLLSALPVSDRFAVTSVAFDSKEELVWTGNSGGYVTSFYGPAGSKYTAWRINMQHEVRCILPMEPGILALAQNNLKLNSRHGLCISEYRGGNFKDMQCMLETTQETVVTVGGHQPVIVQLDLNRMELLQEITIEESGCAILRSDDKFIYSGDVSGKITLRSKDSLQAIHALEAHNGSLSDFDICGNKLISCGFSNRLNTMMCDRFLMVYDIRMLRALPPLTTPFDPMLLRFSSVYSDSQLIVASQIGQFQVLEIGVATSLQNLYQISNGGAAVMCMDISTTKGCLAFGDGGGFAHLFSNKESPTFNLSSNETIFADPPHLVPPIMYQDEYTPLSLIPLSQKPAGTAWLSDWPEQLMQRIYREPKPIDPKILQSMRVVQFIGYAPNPQTERRNQVPYQVKVPSPEKSSSAYNQRHQISPKSGSNSPRTYDLANLVPRMYRKMGIKASKIMSNDFDYRALNRTSYSGIEFHVPNAYVKAVLLVLYHYTPLRQELATHSCRKEFCLTCEMTFLFDMLHSARGKVPVLANNFIRAFRTIPEATALGLVLNDRIDLRTQHPDMEHLIQSFHRFILRQLIVDLSEIGDQKAKDAAIVLKEQKLMKAAEAAAAAQKLALAGIAPSSARVSVDDCSSGDGKADDDVTAEGVDDAPKDISSSQESTPTKAASRLLSRPFGEETSREYLEDVFRRFSQEESAGSGSATIDGEPKPEGSAGTGVGGISDCGTAPKASVRKTVKPTSIEEIFGFEITNVAKCKCGAETTRTDNSIAVSLTYSDDPDPPSIPATPSSPRPVSFASVVQGSLDYQHTSQAWCSKCLKFQSTVHARRVASLPQVMTLSCHVETERERSFWNNQLRLAAIGLADEQSGSPTQLSMQGGKETASDEAKATAKETGTILIPPLSTGTSNVVFGNPKSTSCSPSKFDRDQMDRSSLSESAPPSLVLQSVSGLLARTEKLDDSSSLLNNPTLGLKMCRYKTGCTRPNCRFAHEGESRQRSGRSWVPTTLRMDLQTGINEGVVVEELRSNSDTENPDEDVRDGAEDDPLTNDASDEKAPLSADSTSPGGAATQAPAGLSCKKERRIYHLIGVVCATRDGSDVSHLITCVKVPPVFMDTSRSETSTPEPQTLELPGRIKISNSNSDRNISPVMKSTYLRSKDWLVYNDIIVTYTDVMEVVNFNMEWKIPCLLYYSCLDLDQLCASKSESTITLAKEARLFEEESLAVQRRLSSSSSACIPLDSDEVPKKGDLVGIDAEFVTLNQEEAELRSDGTRSTVRASQMCLARVTCIRGSGSLEFTPFIDDYISTQDEIADYLTEVSGIKPGDLDIDKSSKHLTTLKTTYLKLRYLAESGVVFVGHGLKNDFRMINMVVPHDQVVDTVLLYHLPHQRMVSLRFLAWHFLGLKIQSDTHDSVEDARTALRLYRKYQELLADGSGKLTRTLADMYDAGRRQKWKVPADGVNC